MKMLLKRLVVLFIFCVFVSNSFAQQIKVACVGNSITEGYGIRSEQAYPAILQQLMGDKYEVRNFGVSGRTLLRKGDKPYWKEAKYQQVLAWLPNIVVIKLGTNDSKPQNWRYKDEFKDDYTAFVDSFKALPSNPKIYLCYPIPVFKTKWGITDSVIFTEIIPDIKKVAHKTKSKIIDLYNPFSDKGDLVIDGIHPNAEGAKFIANEVYKAIKK